MAVVSTSSSLTASSAPTSPSLLPRSSCPKLNSVSISTTQSFFHNVNSHLHRLSSSSTPSRGVVAIAGSGKFFVGGNWKCLSSSLLQRWNCGYIGTAKISQLFSMNICFLRRKTLLCAVSKDAEESFKKTVEVDYLIDKLRDADEKELKKLVVENVLAFNEGFWIRLAARSDTCKSEDDKKDYEELASSVMSIVELIVHKTKEKIESATDILKDILRPVVDKEGEICWPPRDPDALNRMEKEINRRELEGQLDEGFLAEVNAQLRQAKEDGDKPGLEAMLQKVLQLYASRVLSKRSYAKKGTEVLLPEQFLETIIRAPEQEWNQLLLDGLTIGKGKVTPEELFSVINKRMERTLIRTEGGSYAQRILGEYLKGIQSRSEEIIHVLEGKTQS